MSWHRHVFLAAVLSLAVSSAGSAQEKSVKPGINDSFTEADPSTFVERFEKEGREVYDFREKIIASLNLKPGMAVADVGAGTGLFTRMMSPLVGDEGQVLAVDITPAFVKHIEMTSRERGQTNVKGIVCTATSVSLPDGSVDTAFICDTYHHFEFPYKTMRSLHKALRDKGELVLVEFHRKEGESSDWIMGHVRASKEVFVEEICRAGFKVVGEENFMKESYLVRFERDERLTESGHTTDSAAVMKEMLAEGTAVLIDVREQKEWDAGHLSQASLLPLSRIMEVNREGEEALQKELGASLPKDKAIYFHCRSGARVLKAAELLAPHGYDIRPLSLGYEELLEAGFSKSE